MNKVVVGHSKVKDGIILALVAQQHVYIEGPPGSAKTLLAETVANQTIAGFSLPRCIAIHGLVTFW